MPDDKKQDRASEFEAAIEDTRNSSGSQRTPSNADDSPGESEGAILKMEGENRSATLANAKKKLAVDSHRLTNDSAEAANATIRIEFVGKVQRNFMRLFTAAIFVFIVGYSALFINYVIRSIINPESVGANSFWPFAIAAIGIAGIGGVFFPLRNLFKRIRNIESESIGN